MGGLLCGIEHLLFASKRTGKFPQMLQNVKKISVEGEFLSDKISMKIILQSNHINKSAK